MSLCQYTTIVSLLHLLFATLAHTDESLPGQWINGGIATFYGGAPDGMDPGSPSFGTKEGSCGYGLLSKSQWPFWSVAGIATANRYFKSLPGKACGACFEIQCVDQRPGACNADPSQRSVTVTVTDSCPECGADHWDLQAMTFAKFATPSIGRVAIQYRRVQCRVPQAVEVRVDNNAGAGGWVRLFVQNVANLGTVQKVEVGHNGQWMQLNNVWGAAWELGYTPNPPIDLRITDEAGEQVIADDVITASGQVGVLPTGVQFGSFGSRASAAGTFSISTTTTSSSSSSGSSTMVTAFQGPAASSSTTGASASANASSGSSTNSGSSSSSSSCADTPPPGNGFTCEQQKGFGKCFEGWMVQGGYCAATCGRCSGGGGSLPPASKSGCTDNPPNAQFSCQQQAQFGKCAESWMLAGAYCRKSCGKC